MFRDWHALTSCRQIRGLTTRVLLCILVIRFSLASTNVGPGTPLTDAQSWPLVDPLKAAVLPGSEIFGHSQQGTHTFTLRHVFHHGAHLYPNLHRRLDLHRDAQFWPTGEEDERHQDAVSLHAKSRPISIQRLVDRRPVEVEALLQNARQSGIAEPLSPSAWILDELPGPNITDKETILTLAKMTNDAYQYPPFTADWKDVNGGFNYSISFGWEADGLRGHIFADESNSTIVIAIKGTTKAVFIGSEVQRNDKINDNLLFSCCCAQGGQYFWTQVCDCLSTTYTCNQTCLVQSLKAEDRYYRAALNLYANVTELYPNSVIWLTGHSLGGSISSLLGLTYGTPVVTFEAPAEALAAARLGLPSPPGSHPGVPQRRPFTGAYHFGHTADPVYMGTCNGPTSICSLWGYAMETQCHTGQECIYDVVQDKGWRVSLGTHGILSVIKDVIEVYDNVPNCTANTECVDCFNWKYFESNGSETTTSRTSTTSSSRTRTSTCKTPGWWGCLDESTTSSGTRTLTTTMTTTITTTTSSASTTTTTCRTPGWFGCRDPTTTSKEEVKPSPTITTTPPPTASPSKTITSTTCVGWWFFGWCKTITSVVPVRTSSVITSKLRDKHRLPQDVDQEI